MKKTLLAAFMLSALTSVHAEYIEWPDATGGLVYGKHDVKLSELKDELHVHMEELVEKTGTSYVENLMLIDSTIEIDQANLYQWLGSTGAPSSVTIGQNVTLNFTSPVVFVETEVGFELGALGDYGVQPGSLTVNLTKEFVAGLEWKPGVEDKIYIHSFMKCSLFTNWGDTADLTVNLEGVDASGNIGGFHYVGYITDPETQLGDNEIGVLAIRTGSDYYNANDPWDGVALSLVARSNVGAPDLPTPEPTTGTLSLLALAGLAARRRRK